MKHIGNIKVVRFDSIEELKDFVDHLGKAKYFDRWDAEYYSIGIDDDRDVVVIEDDEDNVDLEVLETDLPNIYGYLPMTEVV